MEQDSRYADLNKKLNFSREEHLKSKKSIDLLFSKGKALNANPIRLVYFLSDSERTLPQVLFSVSKRNFKKAVDRNKIKRQMREIYRLNKPKFFSSSDDDQYLIALIYTAKEKIPYNILEKKLNLALERLKNVGKQV